MPPTPKKKALLVDVHGEIAVITINLPHKLNALSGKLYQELGYLLREVATMQDITITLLTGNGRFFSAGADISSITAGNSGDLREGSLRSFYLQGFAANNIELTKAFFEHPKILVVALNGPVVGLSAGIISHADFIYATQSTYILAPFTSLGLVAEGGSSYTFVQRLGISKANEALILSKKIPAQELLQCGFLARIYPTPENPNDCSAFHKQVLEDVHSEFLGRGLNRESMLLMKSLIRAGFEQKLGTQNVKEAFMGMERWIIGAPQKEFAALESGQKKHKL